MPKRQPTRREFLSKAAALSAAGAAASCATGSSASPELTPTVGGQASAGTVPAGSVPTVSPAQVATPAAPGRVIGSNDRIRCGFVGVGSRGSSILQSTLSLDGVDVVAICDTYDVWRDRAVGWCKAKQPEVGSYSRFEEMLDKEELDAVVTATPDHIHAPVIFAALDKGLDVYTEKPMTLMWPDAIAVRDRVAETGAVLQVGTQLRSMPMYHKARDVFQSGELGKLVLVQVNRHHAASRLDRARTPGEANEKNIHWKRFLRDTPRFAYDPLRYFHWRQFVDYSNGYFGDLMLHHLDLCHFITGASMPERIKGVGGIYHFDDGRTCPDTVSALVEYGPSFHFNYTTTAANEHYGLVERYLCTQGTIEVRSMSEMSIFRNEIEEVVPSDGILNEPHLQNFFDCMRTREKPIAPVEAGMAGAVCTRMAFESMQGGTAATWDPDDETVRF